MELVVLVQPPLPERSVPRSDVHEIPIGLLSLRSSLEKHGYNCEILVPKSLEDAIGKLRKLAPDVVGISARTPQHRLAIELGRAIKRELESILIAGGPHPTFVYREFLREGFDFIVRGEGEISLPLLLDRLRRGESTRDVPGIAYEKDGKIVVSRIVRPKPDEIPRPDLGYFEREIKRLRHLSLIFTRGCPRRCSFCSIGRFLGREPRRIDPGMAADLMEEAGSLGARFVFVEDPNITENYSWLNDFLHELEKRRVDLEWSCNSLADTFSLEAARSLRRAGCSRISFGIESADMRVLELARKPIPPDVSKRAVLKAREAGLDVIGFFILGLPGETKESIERTIEFASNLPLTMAGFSFATPFPGTRFLLEAERYGRILTEDWSRYSYTSEEPVFVPKGLTERDLKRYMRLAYSRFYLRPRLILESIKRKEIRAPIKRVILSGYFFDLYS